MALKRLTINGYGQIELNQVAFRRDGRIEAQCHLDKDAFSKEVPAENGMLLVVDNVNRLVKMPAGDANELIALNYTTEHMYDERANALKDFYLVPGSFLPRLGYLAKGDKFTTNCLAYDDGEFANDDAVKKAVANFKTVPVYGVPCELGAIKLTAEAGEGVCLIVVENGTMPDGQFGVKLQTIKE